jgi:hypothetical protein
VLSHPVNRLHGGLSKLPVLEMLSAESGNASLWWAFGALGQVAPDRGTVWVPPAVPGKPTTTVHRGSRKSRVNRVNVMNL